MAKKKKVGWVAVHRQLSDNELFKNPNYLSVWMWILLNAEFRDPAKAEVITWKGEKRTLRKGEFTFGAYRIAKETGVSRGSTERAIARFISEEQIEVLPSHNFSLGLVKNWQKYQPKRGAERALREELTEELTEDIYKNIKNTKKKEVKNPNPIAPSDGATVKEKKKRPPQPHYELIEFFFKEKGWEFDPKLARRWFRASREVLDACDENLDLAKQKLLKVKEWADLKVLDWTLETILKRWANLDDVTATAPKKPYIGGCPAYKDSRGDWMIINHDGRHLKHNGPLSDITYA